MDAVGNEIGQKMRSAIKAKLMELGSYVDDELPDYIMVMVANKRSKSQMESDLQLFLQVNTKIFVEWLQQVLKKLKEVRLSNPEMYNELKRKTTIEMAEVVVKKEKMKKIKLENLKQNKLLSDDIPVSATSLVENINNLRRTSDSIDNNESSIDNVNEDSFDIPSISEVNLLEDSELESVADKIKKAKLALMKSDSEDEDFINIKADADELGTELNDSNVDSTNTSNKKQTINLVRQRSNPSSSKDWNSEKIAQKTLSDLRQNLINSREAHLRSIESKQSNASSNATTQKRTISLTERLREEKEISGKIFGNAISKICQSKGEDKKDREINKPREEKKRSVHSRLGSAPGVVPSMVSVPNKKKPESEKRKSPVRSSKVVPVVPSAVQVKPRKASGFCQANKNLLLKAVAEAQRSVTQVPSKSKKENLEEMESEMETQKTDGLTKKSRIMKTFNKNKPALFTKKYQEKRKSKNSDSESDSEVIPKKKSKNILEVKTKNKITEYLGLGDDSNDSEYVPKSKKMTDKTETEYVPSNIDIEADGEQDIYLGDMDEDMPEESLISNEDNDKEISEKITTTTHQFIVTLDGIKDKLPFKKNRSISPTSTTNVDESPKYKKAPSPIIFDKEEEENDTIPISKLSRNIPDTLPKIVIPKAVVPKERCKYWPACRLGENCEFVHPSTSCKLFPNCKFGDMCIYIHPKCKFLTSCTRKDCPYSHAIQKTLSKTVVKPHTTYHTTFHPQDVCKYFPNCTNLKCPFYHPKPCKFGVACLNKAECGFSHTVIPSKEKLKWQSVK